MDEQLLEVRIGGGPAWLRFQVGRMESRPLREPRYDLLDRLTHRDSPDHLLSVFHVMGFGATEAIARAMASAYGSL